jgi:ATP-dependent HslUV protease ATP-binding subunit HslU
MKAIEEIAKAAYDINLNTENTGARRLQSLVEKIMEEYSFNAPTMSK